MLYPSWEFIVWKEIRAMVLYKCLHMISTINITNDDEY